jgi:hypothetical protein
MNFKKGARNSLILSDIKAARKPSMRRIALEAVTAALGTTLPSDTVSTEDELALGASASSPTTSSSPPPPPALPAPPLCATVSSSSIADFPTYSAASLIKPETSKYCDM